MLTEDKTERQNVMTGCAVATSRMDLKVMDQPFSDTTQRMYSPSVVQRERRGSYYSVISIRRYTNVLLAQDNCIQVYTGQGLGRCKPRHICT